MQKVSELQEYLGNDAYSFLLKLQEDTESARAYVGKWIFFSEETTSKCIVLDQSATSAEVMEFHKEYVDIHVTLSGRDTMFFGEEIIKHLKEYDIEGDFGLVKVNRIREQVISEGHFLLIEPDLPHVNILNTGSLKVVFKRIHSHA